MGASRITGGTPLHHQGSQGCCQYPLGPKFLNDMTNNNNELLNNELLNNEDRGGHEQSLYPRNTNEPHGLHTLLNTTRRWLEPTPSSPMCKTRIAQRTTTVRHCCYSPYQTPVHRQLPTFTTTTKDIDNKRRQDVPDNPQQMLYHLPERRRPL